MFKSYSERARLVILIARLESGARGAEMIDDNDLVAALIVEDQNKITDIAPLLAELVTPLNILIEPV
jgi:hypothetical protein